MDENEVQTNWLVRGNVYQREDGRKVVVREDSYELKPGEKFVCSRPHEDGSFAYLCNSQWCRCSQ